MDYPQPTYGGPAGMPPAQGPGVPQPPAAGRRGKKAKKDKPEGQPATKRVIDRQLKIALGFALAVALVVLGLMYGGTAPEKYVVRAVASLPAGAVIDVDTQLEAVPVPDEFLEQDVIWAGSADEAMQKAREDVNGQRVQFPVQGGEQISTGMFNVEINLAETLAEDERLVSVSATVAQAVAGNILPGDYVDVAASTDAVSGVVLSNVQVVSVTVSENQFQAVAEQQTGEGRDTKPDELLPGNPVPGIYVLRATAEDAARLVAVDAGADLSLIYRPKDSASLTPSEPLSATSVICESNPTVEACSTFSE